MSLKHGVVLFALVTVAGLGSALYREARRAAAVQVIQGPSAKGGGHFRGPSAPLHLRKLFSVGTLDGSDGPIFGVITGAIVDSSGRLFILDAMKHRLTMFSSAGRLLNQTGREGSGPGEFTMPTALAILNRDVYILDSGRSRIVAFRIGSRSLTLDGEIPLKMAAYDLCAMKGHLYVLGLSKRELVHEITPSGFLVRSFAKPHSGPHFLSMMLAQGHIACDPLGGRVTILSSVLPMVRSYSSHGVPLWVNSLKDFHATRITLAGSGVEYEAVHGYSDMTLGAVTLDGRYVLVQVGSVSQKVPDPDEVQKVSTEWFALGSGSQVYRNRNLPRVMDAENGRWVAFSNLPYPHVDVFTYALVRGA